MSQALANVQYSDTAIGTEKLGQIMVKSGFFKDTRDEAQAIVKILYGKELGFGPMASMLGVYIVEGRPSLSAQLIASAIQKSGTYRYRVREWTATVCRIEFFERGESLGESSFSMEDATRAGLAGKQVWKAYSKAMLWARAISQGARAYTPDVFNGAIYTPEELGAVVNAEGDVIDVGTGEVVEERRTETPINRKRAVLEQRYGELLIKAHERGMADIAAEFDPAWSDEQLANAGKSLKELLEPVNA